MEEEYLLKEMSEAMRSPEIEKSIERMYHLIESYNRVYRDGEITSFLERMKPEITGEFSEVPERRDLKQFVEKLEIKAPLWQLIERKEKPLTITIPSKTVKKFVMTLIQTLRFECMHVISSICIPALIKHIPDMSDMIDPKSFRQQLEREGVILHDRFLEEKEVEGK